MLVQAVTGAVAVALMAGPITTGAAGAQGVDASSSPVKPAAVTKRFDVDGDRRADRVTVSPVRTGQYLLTVTTARGRTVRVPVRSTFAQDWGAPNPWVLEGGIDGVPGAEIVLGLTGGDGVAAAVLTWRGGKLVNLAPPPGRGRDWYWLGVEWGAAGYRFWTAGGQRKVATAFFEKQASGKWSGVLTTSVWAATGWRQLDSRLVSVSEKTAQSYVGLNGVTPAR